jgi:hypothetical protein
MKGGIEDKCDVAHEVREERGYNSNPHEDSNMESKMLTCV